MYEAVLQMVEFATRDLQSIMRGAADMAYSDSHTATVAENGVNRIIVANATADAFVVGQTISIGSSRSSDSVAANRLITSIDAYDASNKALSFDGAAVNIAVGNVVANRPWKNGATDIITASSGSLVSNSSGKYPCIWRGKVDPWADAYSGLCDVLLERTGTEGSYTYKVHVIDDPTDYNAGSITADYRDTGLTLPTSDGYITELQQDTINPDLTIHKTAGGSDVTYYPDYSYYPRYDVCVVFVGGSWSDGSGCGSFSFLCYSYPSSVGIYRLARLFVSRA